MTLIDQVGKIISKANSHMGDKNSRRDLYRVAKLFHALKMLAKTEAKNADDYSGLDDSTASNFWRSSANKFACGDMENHLLEESFDYIETLSTAYKAHALHVLSGVFKKAESRAKSLIVEYSG